MLHTIEITGPRSPPNVYMTDTIINGSGISIPYIDPHLYNPYMHVDMNGINVEGGIDQSWLSFHEAYGVFRLASCETVVLSPDFTPMVAFNHHIRSVGDPLPSWHHGFIDGRRDIWLRTMYVCRVAVSNDYHSIRDRTRSLLNRFPHAELYIIDTVNRYGEARALKMFTETYIHSRKGSSILMRLAHWELDDRILWLLASLYARIAVYMSECGPYVFIIGRGLMKGPTKSTASCIDSFKGWTCGPPGMDHVIRVLTAISEYITNEPKRLSDPHNPCIHGYMSRYSIEKLSPNLYISDPTHTEDMGHLKKVNIVPDFADAAPIGTA